MARIGVHYDNWLADHPNMLIVDESAYSALLKWANQKGKAYIRLERFAGISFYTKEMLEIAKMWAEKDNKRYDVKKFKVCFTLSNHRKVLAMFKTSQEAQAKVDALNARQADSAIRTDYFIVEEDL